MREPAAVVDAWHDVPVPPARVPLLGPRSLLARLAEGEFADAFPMLDFHKPPHDAGDGRATRHAVADALEQGNAALGNPLDEATVAALRGRGRIVIAGQQPGLLLGPMFTLLKAVTAVAATRRLQHNGGGAPLIPAFWIASEDHDLEEVNRCTMAGQRLVLDHPQLHRPGPRPPVGRVPLDDHRGQIDRFIRHATADLPHADLVQQLTADLDLRSYATQFGQLLARLMRGSGLVLVDPDWLRPLSAPALAAAAERWPAINEALQHGRRDMAARDLPVPLDRVNIFALNRWGGREPATITPHTPAAIAREPERYSPSAALRPLVQDALLPTAGTIGGPTELLYLWQIEPLYQVLELTRSPLLPRLSATVIDGPTRRRIRRLGLAEDAAIFHILDHLDQAHYAPPAPTDEADLRELETLADRLTERLARIDEPHERRTIEKAIGSIRYRIDRVTRRVRQHRLDRHGVGLRSLRRVAEVVYPNRQLQERSASALEMIGRHGPELLDALRRLDVTRIAHHLLWPDQPAGLPHDR